MVKNMINIKICTGTSCHLKGAYNVMTTFIQLIEKYSLHEKVSVVGSYCTGNCQEQVNVKIDGKLYSVNPMTAKEFFIENVLPLTK